MIVFLKMHASGKTSDRIRLKAIRDTFFLICSLWSVDRGTKFFSRGNIQQKGDVRTFGLQEDPQIPSLSGTSWSSHKPDPEDGAWSAYCNDFEKIEWEYFLSNQ